MVNIAVVGAGGYAFSVIQRLVTLSDVCRLTAVTSNPQWQDAGAAWCRSRDIPVYDHLDGMLDELKGKCDVILVPTPIPTHYEIARACLAGGFDVFLEKPPVATVQDLDDLRVRAKQAGKSVGVCFQYLYSNTVQTLKKRLCTGAYGAVKRIRSMAGWERLDSYYLGANWFGKLRLADRWVLDGTINNPLAHMLANSLYFACPTPAQMAAPVSVQAELYHGHRIESEDTSSLRIMTDRGVEIIFNATLCPLREMEPITVIEAEKATIEYVDFEKAVIRPHEGPLEEIVEEQDPRLHMLREMTRSWREQTGYVADLDICRPFTVAVNGAFESCGRPHDIDERSISRRPKGDSVKTVIEGIDEVICTAHANGRLFSEIGVPWARASSPFPVEHYDSFAPGWKIEAVL